MKRAIPICFCLCFAAAAIAGQSLSENWSAFRGPNARGVAEGHPTATTWDAEKSVNIKWKTEIPGLGHSSPVTWGNRVFVTTAVSVGSTPTFRPKDGGIDSANDNVKHSWRVYCLDKRDGRVIWERVAHEGVPRARRHLKASQVNSTPATNGQVLVAVLGSEGLFCYDLNGKLLWREDLGLLDPGYAGDLTSQWGYASSPVIYKNLVIVQCDIQTKPFMAAYDIKTGKRVWRTERNELPSWGTPTVYEGKSRTELITNSPGYIRGLDPATGRELWRFFDDNTQVKVPTTIVAHDLIFATGGNPRGRPIYTFRPGGTGEIKESSLAWRAPRGSSYTTTPLVYGDYLYICADNGVLTCYNARTGGQIYQQRIGDRGATFSASPVAADGKIYCASEDGDVYVIKAGPAYELLATNSMGSPLMATPAISDGLIIVRAQNHVFGIR
ncbi:MAG TPA: PQQ-binding-like beta-propeller repeat protein [Blastocatellia bacterium]|nr:PQQ-binding-like beta-propeller repeat protein [Blastocatellia bacterium]